MRFEVFLIGLIIVAALSSVVFAVGYKITKIQNVYRLSNMKISDDGSRLFFVDRGSSDALWDNDIMMIQDGQAYRVTNNLVYEESFGITPDGNIVVYTVRSQSANAYDVYATKFDGSKWSNPRQIITKYTNDIMSYVFVLNNKDFLLCTTDNPFFPQVLHCDVYKGDGSDIWTSSQFTRRNVKLSPREDDGSTYVSLDAKGNYATSIKYSYDGSNNIETVKVWRTELSTGLNRYIASFQLSTDSLFPTSRVSRNGDVVVGAVGGEYGVNVLYRKHGEQTRSLKKFSDQREHGDEMTVGISPDGSKVVVIRAKDNRRAHIIDTETGEDYIFNGDFDTTDSYLHDVSDDASSFVILKYDYYNSSAYFIHNDEAHFSGLINIGLKFIGHNMSMPSVYASGTKSSPGKELTVNVKASSLSQTGSLEITYNYDPAVLELEEVKPGLSASNILFDYTNGTGTVRAAAVSTLGIPDGTLFSIKFRVKENLTKRVLDFIRLGGYPVDTRINLSAYDLSGNETFVSSSAGRILLVTEDELMRGDVNMDGTINSADASLAMEMALGKIEEKPVADMNRDGKVTTADVLLILKEATNAMLSKIQTGGIKTPGSGGFKPMTPKI